MLLGDYLVESIASEYPDLDESSIVESITDGLETVMSDTLRDIRLPEVPSAPKRRIFEKRLERAHEATRDERRRRYEQRVNFLSLLWTIQSKLDGFKSNAPGKQPQALGSRTSMSTAEALQFHAGRQPFFESQSDFLRSLGAQPPLVSLTDLSYAGLRERIERVVEGIVPKRQQERLTVPPSLNGLANRDSIFRAYVEAVEDFYASLIQGEPLIVRGELQIRRDVEEPDWQVYKLEIGLFSESPDTVFELWRTIDELLDKKKNEMLAIAPFRWRRRLEELFDQTYTEVTPLEPH